MELDLSRSTMDVIDLTEEREKERRERIATAAMQGLLSYYGAESDNGCAKRAIQYADELIKQLDGEE